MTEEKAKTLECPLRYASGGANKCITGKCMLWHGWSRNVYSTNSDTATSTENHGDCAINLIKYHVEYLER
jgi:hypothetical protein